MVHKEVCQNPWLKHPCKNTDIVVYIVYENQRLPICRKCWEKIAESDLEWGST